MKRRDNILRSLQDIIFLVDQEYIFIDFWTDDIKSLFVPPKEFIGKSIDAVYANILPSLGQRFISAIEEVKLNQKPITIRYKHPSENQWFKARINAVKQEDKDDEAFYTIAIRDITEELEVSEKKNLFENIVLNNWDAIVFANLEGQIQVVNPAANRLYGYEGEELIGESVDIFNSHKSHDTGQIIQSIIDEGFWSGEIIQKRKNGQTFLAFLSVQIINDGSGKPIGYASHSKDLTEEVETKQNLRNTIEEKETLLRELHHRVKNNLAIIQGMLRIQINDFQNEHEKKLMRSYLDRIDSIAILHNSLYRSEDVNKVQLKGYITDLFENIVNSYAPKDNTIQTNAEVDDVEIDISTAIPLGLIVNELTTNSFKHAFYGNNDGKVNLSFHKKGKDLKLTVQDNGSGFKPTKEPQSLGLSLVNDLAAQIDGTVEFNNKNGTKVQVTFQENTPDN